MKRPRIGLGYVMELVATAAVCFGLMRALTPDVNPGGRATFAVTHLWVRMWGGALLTGLALGGGVGLGIETIRGRRPSTWGLGRWIWSISLLFMLFNVAEEGIYLATKSWRMYPRSSSVGVILELLLQRTVAHQFFGDFGWAIAAVCATAMVARSPRDAEPDAREWAGRVFASLAVALHMAESMLRATGR